MHRRIELIFVVFFFTATILVNGQNQAHACDPAEWIEEANALSKAGLSAVDEWDAGGAFSHLISLSVSGKVSDCNAWLTPDEEEIFFIRQAGQGPTYDPTQQGSWDIYQAEWSAANEEWAPPQNLGTNINTADAERSPTTTFDGDTLIFAVGVRIYYSVRSGGLFQPRVEIAALLGYSDPCLSHDGSKLYLVQNSDILVADRGATGAIDDWTTPVSVGGAVNTAYAEVRPYISRDDNLLLFSDFGNSRPGGYGGPDLWVSSWNGSSWDTPLNVGAPINTHQPACTPWLSEDGERLYASSGAFVGGRGGEDLWVAYLDSTPGPAATGESSADWVKLGELDSAWVVFDLAVDQQGRLFAATAPGGRVYRSVDDGASWSETANLEGAIFAYSLLVTDDGTLFTGTYPKGEIFFSVDAGTTWVKTDTIAGATAVRTMIETHDGRILAGTTPLCELYQFDWGDSSWSKETAFGGMSSGLSVLFETGDSILYAGGTDNAYVLPNSSPGWIAFATKGHKWTVDDYFEDDDGTVWMAGWEHGAGAYVSYRAPGSLSWVESDSVGIDTLDAVSVHALARTAEGDLLAGISPGPGTVVLASRDTASTWSALGTLAGAREIHCLLQLEDGTIYAGCSPEGDVYRLETVTIDVDNSPETGGDIPLQAGLVGGAPNPFRSRTSIQYRLAGAADFELQVVDMAGRSVRTLHGGVATAAGMHSTPWDGRNDAGHPVSSGVYFALLRSGGETTRKKLILIR